MFEALDPLLLSRIQFAFVVSFHIIFPAFTIGLASWLTVVEYKYLKTGNTYYAQVYKHWVKIFAVAFGLGVVSGVVMSYQFGTNWAVFSDKIGNVLGPLLAYEVLTAFFLEASFLGIMLFGWGRVSKRMHFASTLIVAVGTLISAFWILAANSFMQTPQGFYVGENGLLHPTSWSQIIFNPSFPYRYVHMVTAAFLSTAFVVGAVGAYYLSSPAHKEHREHGKIMLGMAMIIAVFVAPLQVLIGDAHGLNTFEHQPMKVAAMEGNWDTQKGIPLILFALPDQEAQTNRFEISIPKLSSLILTHHLDGEVPGLKEVAPEDRPPVAVVFWAFRIMVGIGTLMVLVGLISAYLYLKGKAFSTRWFHKLWICMAPTGFIAILAGWFVTEVGRQPYTVYGVIRTSESVSPVLGQQVMFSLLGFIVVYSLVFGAGVYYVIQLIKKGPKPYDSGHANVVYDNTLQENYAKTLSKELDDPAAEHPDSPAAKASSAQSDPKED